MRVLIIGRDAEDRRSLRLGLQGLGSRFVLDTGGFENGLERLASDEFDAAFVDAELIDFDDPAGLRALSEAAPSALLAGFSKHAEVHEAVEAVHLGFEEFFSMPFKAGRLEKVFRKFRQQLTDRRRTSRLEAEQSRTAVPLRFESGDEVMKEVFKVASRVAATDASVLILGESGTGKSVLADAIHQGSGRSDEDIVTVHCPSLSRELLESELFGHKKGAFTGAVSDKRGKVQEADGGTLFLDEIGELPMELQAKLLRLLQERAYERVGDPLTRHADLRVISATNRDLAEEVTQGDFREDLFYRLNVITIEMPPLRARPHDLVRIAEDYVGFFARKLGSGAQRLSPSAIAAIRHYPWPGNLRELRNVIERATILCGSDTISNRDLGLGEPEDSQVSRGYPSDMSLAEVEKAHMRQVLAEAASIEESAEKLGINASTLYRKRRRYGLD